MSRFSPSALRPAGIAAPGPVGLGRRRQRRPAPFEFCVVDQQVDAPGRDVEPDLAAHGDAIEP
jgi:hypothetical protein